MAISKKTGKVYLQFPRLFIITKQKSFSTETRDMLIKIQKTIKKLIQQYPKETNELHKQIWGEEKELVFPIFVGAKAVLTIQTDILFGKKIIHNIEDKHIKGVHEDPEVRLQGVKDTIQKYIQMIIKKETPGFCGDFVYNVYKRNFPYIKRVNQYVEKAKKVLKKHPYLPYIKPLLYKNMMGAIDTVHQKWKWFNIRLKRSDMGNYMYAQGKSDDVFEITSVFFKSPVIVRENGLPSLESVETIWKEYVEKMENRFREIENGFSLSFEDHPIFKEAKRMFEYKQSLEELYPIWNKIKELEKVVYSAKSKQSKEAYILRLFQEYVSLPFPKEMWKVTEKDLKIIDYEKIDRLMELYPKEKKYPPIKEVERILLSYYKDLRGNQTKQKRYIKYTELIHSSKLQPFEIKSCFQVIQTIQGKNGADIITDVLKGRMTDEIVERILHKHRLFGKIPTIQKEDIVKLLKRAESLGFISERTDIKRLLLTENGMDLLRTKEEQDIMSLNWEQFKIQLKSKKYGKMEKTKYLEREKEKRGFEVYREVMDLVCEDPSYIRFVLKWLQENYVDSLQFVFDLYGETKEKGHVKELLEDVQNGMK